MRKKLLSLSVIFLVFLSLLAGCGADSTSTSENRNIEDYTIYLDAGFEQNLLFSTYDIDIYIDDEPIGTILHGKNFTKELQVPAGQHALVFYKNTDNGVKATKKITVTEDTTFSFTLHSNSSSIEVKNFSSQPGIIGNSLVFPNIVGMSFDEAKKTLTSCGFVNISSETVNNTMIWDDSAWTVIEQNIEAGSLQDKNVDIVLKCEKPGYMLSPEEEIPDESIISSTSDDTSLDAVSYSTNDKAAVKEGNHGIYAYKTIGNSYDLYYIIDFDEGYIYSFSDGNGNTICDRTKIVSGDLNSGLITTYHDGADEWSYGLHFCWKNQPDHLIVQDNDGFEYDFYTTNLKEALALRDQKTIVNY